MGTQVITITPDGVVSGLQRKPGQGIDLRKLGGPACIKRASLIEWDETAQAWFIDVLQNAGKGVLTWGRFSMAVRHSGLYAISHMDNTVLPGRAHTQDWYVEGGYRNRDGRLLFRDYDDAVKVEIAFLDALRIAGKS